MARPILILALVLFALVGLAFASHSSPAPTTGSPSSDPVPTVPVSSPTSDSEIGNNDDGAPSSDNDVVEAPVGGPDVPPGTSAPTAESPKSGVAALEVSAAAGVAVAAIAGYFF